MAKSKRKIEQIKNISRETSNIWMLYLIVFDLFNWTLPDEIRKEFIEWQLLKFGYVAIWIDQGKYYCGFITALDFDSYGIPKDGSSVQCITRWGDQFNKTLGKDCIIIYNNDIRTPDIWLGFFANMLSECDTSQYTLAKKSRCCPLPVVSGGANKATVDEAIKSVDQGITTTVVDEDTIRRLSGDENQKYIDMVNITYPSQIQNMQYLSKFHDDLMRRFCNIYGLPLQSTGKMAQVTEKEIEGYSTLSLVIPDQMMRARKDGIALGKRVFGESFPFDIDYGEPWKIQNSLTKKDATENVETSGEESENENNQTNI